LADSNFSLSISIYRAFLSEKTFHRALNLLALNLEFNETLERQLSIDTCTISDDVFVFLAAFPSCSRLGSPPRPPRRAPSHPHQLGCDIVWPFIGTMAGSTFYTRCVVEDAKI
jgi:hypothetical protein